MKWILWKTIRTNRIQLMFVIRLFQVTTIYRFIIHSFNETSYYGSYHNIPTNYNYKKWPIHIDVLYLVEWYYQPGSQS